MAIIGIIGILIFIDFAFCEEMKCCFVNTYTVEISGFHFHHHHREPNFNLFMCMGEHIHLLIVAKFRNSSLSYIPPEIFIYLYHLEQLDVANSGVIDLLENTFIAANSLRQLNASKNLIENITTSIFSETKELDTIDLSYNRISELTEYSFNGLNRLRVLNLTNNQLTILPAGLFDDNIALEFLNLGGNKIANLEPNIFAKLDHLREIDLSENQLVYMDVNIFQNAKMISSIDLTNNELRNLRLNVSNTLGSVLAGYNQIQSFSFNCTCGQLKILNLTHNNLSDLGNCSSLRYLSNLDLSYNNIGTINATTFVLLKKIERLNLRHTNFSGLKYGTFSKHLKSLDLSENNMQTLNLDMLYVNKTLQQLYLSGNNFSEFSGSSTFSSFSALSKVDLRRNNFNCSYLSQLIGRTNSTFFTDFDNQQFIDDRSFIHGIECYHNNSNSSVIDSTEKLHKLAQTERELVLLKLFIIIIITILVIIVILSVGAIFYSFSKPSSTEHRSTNNIQSLKINFLSEL